MKRLIFTALTVSMSGCFGPISQLNDWHDLESSKQYDKIEAEVIDSDCVIQSGKIDEACPKLFAIHARACLTLARIETAETAACPPDTESARQRMDCAAADYDKARSGDFPNDQLVEFTEHRARALYCGAHFRTRSEGLPLAREAVAELSRLPANPRRDHLAASAHLFVAGTDQVSAADRCQSAKTVLHLTNRGLSDGSASVAVADGLRGAQAAANRIIDRVNGCRRD